MAKQNYKNIELPAKYVPKKSEPYMCPEQKAYFYQILVLLNIHQLSMILKNYLNFFLVGEY